MPIKSLTTLTTAPTLEELVEDGRNTAIYLSPFPEQEKKKFSASDTNLRDDKSSDPGKVCPTRAIQGQPGTLREAGSTEDWKGLDLVYGGIPGREEEEVQLSVWTLLF